MSLNRKTLLFTLGTPFSPLYGQAMKVRAYLYRKNIFKRYDVGVPVISVGNLTMGGTGKTPLVIYLASLLKAQGFKPAVVSRGYRGSARGPVHIVSEGRELLLSARRAGDEPYLIAQKVPGVVVATGKKRRLPCRHVVDVLGCDVILLDDGFQHMALSRSLDLVLFDADYFAGNSRVFPGGDLREPVSALNRCSAFIITGVNEKNRARAEKRATVLQNRFDGKPVIHVRSTYTHAVKYPPRAHIVKEERVSLADLPTDLFCFCGIARPERFLQCLENQGITPKQFITFRDHHDYTVHDIKTLCADAHNAGAAGLITTEKDMVKIATHAPYRLPLYVPVMGLMDNQHLNELIMNHLSEKSYE